MHLFAHHDKLPLLRRGRRGPHGAAGGRGRLQVGVWPNAALTFVKGGPGSLKRHGCSCRKCAGHAIYTTVFLPPR